MANACCFVIDSGRKPWFLVVRSDGSVNLGSNQRSRRTQQLITNAVAVITSLLSLYFILFYFKFQLFFGSEFASFIFLDEG